MTRTRRAALVAIAVPTVLLLGACAGAAGASGSAEQTAPANWPELTGIAPDLVYVTEIDGFSLATQSVGVSGDDGMSAAYVQPDSGAIVTLRTWRGPADLAPTAVPCAELPDSSDAVQQCIVERGGVHVLLEGENVDAATLRAAADAVRAPTQDDIDVLFGGLDPEPRPPVERGDLPEEGDGAPVDPPGLGG